MAIESTQSSVVLSSQKPILTTTQIHSIIMSSEHISSRCASSVHRQYVDGGGRNNKKKKPINIDGRVRGLFLAVYSYHAQASEVAAAEGHGGTTSQAEGAAHENPTGQGSYTESNTEFAHEEAHDSSHAAVHAVLFPWFAQIIGIFVYYFLSRYAHALPYTAVMFVMGFSMGYSMVHHKNMETILKESLITWMAMPGQLILLVFLPGLLYIDSYHIDVHLFIKSFQQLLIFAFPMVLAGTTLTACVAYFIFPFGWNLDLCFTFGSILSATDPVAVAVLLNELGAPPRLKMHVSGEALMNDGSAYVFYTIFKARYVFAFGIPGIGKDVNWGEGFKLFFQLALGGMCIGLAFGFGSVILLFALNRRLSGGDSLAQVVVTITAAYLAYFSSEVAGCSGSLWGYLMVSVAQEKCDRFARDGDDPDTTTLNDALLSKKDWGYLVLLFILLTIIRSVLMLSFYPIISRIGIGSSWQEVVFISWSGLRGAVGIALALSLQSEVWQLTDDEPDETLKHLARQDAEKIFGFVGGIALLTLIINAPTCGPLLKKLGLITPTETRVQMVENYKQHVNHFCLTQYVSLLAESRFDDLDYTVVKEHVSFLQEISYEQLKAAVEEHKVNTPAHDYLRPNLKNVIPYLKKISADEKASLVEAVEEVKKNEVKRRYDLLRNRAKSIAKIKTEGNPWMYGVMISTHESARELRIVVVEALRSAYARIIDQGELESRSFIAYSLNRSLDYAGDSVSRGFPLNDWDCLQVASNSFLKYTETALHGFLGIKHQIKHRTFFRLDRGYFLIHMRTCKVLAFIKAHELAKGGLKKFCSNASTDEYSAAEIVVLRECDIQIQLAEDALNEIDKEQVQQVKSHYACQILLNKAAHFLQTLTAQGLMTQGEAGGILEEIEDHVQGVVECQKEVHEGEYTPSEKISFMRKFSRFASMGVEPDRAMLNAVKEDDDASNGMEEHAEEQA
eukprot:scaffold11699_cov139-Skeletonema_marinoi.AAC.7